MQYSEHIFKELEEQHNLICFKGWYFNDTVSLNDYTYKPKDNYNCSRDGKVLVRASEIANKDQFYNIFMEMKNRRTNATFKFNEWQFNKDQFLDDLGYLPTCDDDIYNVSYWITFEPNAALKEGITNTALTIEGVMGVEEETEGEKDKKPKKKKKAKEGKEGKEGKEVDEKSDEKPKAEAEKELPEGAELPDSLEGEDTKKKGKSKKKKKKD